ncbi:MAG: hypothetical protein QW292_05755 [Candidatus Parvarchaeota archaeon]
MKKVPVKVGPTSVEVSEKSIRAAYEIWQEIKGSVMESKQKGKRPAKPMRNR